ncbi:uncharacterized protein LOC113295166 [Papaver somniferum]|uniref:uncharacterized protein LOC113295166 n=1 Tax=Papaver somniferum TaxID=3469 RepID=UPI000E6F901A|nr:uncharacterized protein LOC113295166 [Papaver somniferum]
MNAFKQRVIQFTRECDVRTTRTMWDSSYDLQILKFFDLKYRKVKTTKISKIFFYLPEPSFTLTRCDGASSGNPGEAGGLGLATNFMAEIFAIICAGEWGVSNNLLKICFRIDSQIAITTFQSGDVPWWACTTIRWNMIKNSLHERYFSHNYREINFSTDILAKKGIGLAKGEKRSYYNSPIFLRKMEVPDLPYYKFD